MALPSTLLKELLRERHWQKYATFCKEWDRAAPRVDPALVGRHPSRSQFARWLAGDLRSLPHPDACRVLEAMFPSLTVEQLFRTGISHPRPVAGASRSIADSAPQSGSTRFADVPSVEVPAQEAGTSVDGSLSEEIAMAAEESARFVRRTRGAVDHDVLDQLDADVLQMARDFLVKPPFVMFRSLSALRAEVFDFLDERQRPVVLPGLYRVAGQLCALLAHACADLGQAYAAETHTRTAWLCADMAEDNPLRAYVKWVQSNVAYWNGDFRKAAEIAQNGKRYAFEGTSLLRLASQEARAFAAAADHDEAERALATASAARSVIAGTPDELERGVFRFEPGKAAYYASEVRLALGGRENFQRAADEAKEALELLAGPTTEGQCPEFRAAAQLDLVAAYLALDDLDAAQQHLIATLALPTESRTLPVVKRINDADRALSGQRFARSPLANDLREQIHLFCAYTATRELPAFPS